MWEGVREAGGLGEGEGFYSLEFVWVRARWAGFIRPTCPFRICREPIFWPTGKGILAHN